MEIKMSIVVCAACNVPFAIGADHESRLRQCHNVFYCPNGHQQHFPGKSDVEVLREKLNRERELVALYKQKEAREEEERAKKLAKRRAAAKKAATKKPGKK